MNLCRVCGLDFHSVRDFDAHRVGKHAYTFQEGLRMDPPVEDGRRCLDHEEMLAEGWSLSKQGRWRRRPPQDMPIAVLASLREATRGSFGEITRPELGGR